MSPILRAVALAAVLGGAVEAQLLRAVPPQVPAAAAWRPIPGLIERVHHAIAYDPRRGRAVLFGGLGEYVLNDTWEWDGVTWEHRRTAHAPAPRWAHAMAYDPLRQTVLLFGGWDRSGDFGDTWEWDGREWRELHPGDAPSPRGFATIATDAARQRVVLFGGAPKGFLAGPHGDTWEWDGTTWRERLPATRPGARAEASMAYDAVAQRVVLFGGNNFGILPNTKTWLWDGLDWTEVRPPLSPSRRVKAGAATDPSTGRVVLHGGEDTNAYLNDTWVWEGAAWRDVSPPARPPVRPSAVLFPDGSRTRMFGGGRVSGTPPAAKRETWSWDGALWTVVHDVPRPTGPLQAVYDPARDEILLVGNNGYPPEQADAWVLRGESFVQVPAPSPSMVLGPSHLAYHAPSGEVICVWNGELWLWDGQSWRFDSNAPGAFWRQRPVYDTHRHRLVFVDLPNQCLWEWDGQQWSQTPYGTGGPPLRQSYALGYDPDRRRIVLFGGALPGASTDTWEWDGVRWHRLHPPTRPPNLTYAKMIHVPALGGLLLFGGNGNPPPTDNWLWDGTGWTHLEGVEGPAGAQLVAGAAYDAGRQRLVAFLSFLENTALAPQAWELDVDTLRASRPYPRPGESLDLDVSLPEQAGNPVALFLSESARPGIPLRVVPGVGTELLPLTPGPLFSASAQLALVRTLDSLGRARFTLPIPNDPSLHWLRFHAAGVALQGLAASAITNGVPLQVVK